MLKNGGFSMKIVTEKIIVKMKMIAKDNEYFTEASNTLQKIVAQDSPYMNRFANDMHA